MSKREYCVGIIMDGNRRWAKKQGEDTFFGHKAGLDTLIGFVKHYTEHKKTFGISHYIFYAFSTENWNRSKTEVLALMRLLEEGLDRVKDELAKQEHPPRFRVIGDTTRLAQNIQEKIIALENDTAQNSGTVALAISYGGRDEIVRACNNLKGEEVTEQIFSQALDTHDIPDPDIIIRTGKEYRLSNFLLWQVAYSELFFLETLWPDFSGEILERVMHEFALREQRHGK